MHRYQRLAAACLAALILCLLRQQPVPAAENLPGPASNDRSRGILAQVAARLEPELTREGFSSGAALYIRIFKIPGELEVWLQKNGTYTLFKSYPICDFSGFLGPKLEEGDWQSPEGFYQVAVGQLNPESSYHLAFNIGYPNKYDRQMGRSGSNIMVHGSCSSRGCFAMSNSRMEEIYYLAQAALAQGVESFPVHIFPFRMTRENMNKFRSSPWYAFWQQLQPGFSLFEEWRVVPQISVKEGGYRVHRPMQLARRDPQ